MTIMGVDRRAFQDDSDGSGGGDSCSGGGGGCHGCGVVFIGVGWLTVGCLASWWSGQSLYGFRFLLQPADASSDSHGSSLSWPLQMNPSLWVPWNRLGEHAH